MASQPGCSGARDDAPWAWIVHYSEPTEVTDRKFQRKARGMHKIAIPSYAIERVLARRGRLHPFEDLDPAHTALIVVDLQNGFMEPGQPAEIAQAREIVPAVNRLARA